MKVIIEMTREEARLAVSSGALLALLNEEETAANEKPCRSEPDTLAEVPEDEPDLEPAPTVTTASAAEVSVTAPLGTATTGQAPQQAVSQLTPSVMPVTPVATTERTYSTDELASAAMGLMQQGMQTQLQGLLKQFGVAALPELSKEQYGAFATALRGMGAQI